MTLVQIVGRFNDAGFPQPLRDWTTNFLDNLSEHGQMVLPVHRMRANDDLVLA